MDFSYKGYFLEEYDDSLIHVYRDADSWRANIPSFNAHNEQEAKDWIDSQLSRSLARGDLLLNYAQELIEQQGFGSVEQIPSNTSYYITNKGFLAGVILSYGAGIKGRVPPTIVSFHDLMEELFSGFVRSETIDSLALVTDSLGLRPSLERLRDNFARGSFDLRPVIEIVSTLISLIDDGMIGQLTDTDYSWQSYVAIPITILGLLIEKGADSRTGAVSRDDLIDDSLIHLEGTVQIERMVQKDRLSGAIIASLITLSRQGYIAEVP